MKVRLCVAIASLAFAATAFAERNPCSSLFATLADGKDHNPVYDFVPLHSAAASAVSDDTFYTLTYEELKEGGVMKAAEKIPDSRLLVVADDVDRKRLRTALNTTIEKPAILAYIPESPEGVANVFHTSDAGFSRVAAKQLRRVADELRHVDRVIVHAAPAKADKSQAASLADAIDANANHPLIIIAHHENGELHFPDGTSMQISALVDAAQRKNVVPVVLACSTIEAPGSGGFVATTAALKFEDIAAGVDAAQRHLGDRCMYLGDWLKVMDTTLASTPQRAARHQRTVVIAIASAAGIGVIYAIAQPNPTNDNEKK